MRKMFAFVLMVQAVAFAGVVQGQVTDSVTGEPVAGATVAVEGSELGAFTDYMGWFSIEGVEGEAVVLRVSSVGHRPNSFEFSADEFAGAGIALVPAVAGETTIVVTGTGTPRFFMDTPVATSVITRENIEMRSESDLFGSLELSTGVRVENNCQNCNFTQVRIHGLEGQYTQVLIDGDPVVSSLAKVYGLQQFPAEMIEQIEVVKGGGSALYGGSAVAGVVNLITRRPRISGTTIALESGFADGGSEKGLSFTSSSVDMGGSTSMVIYGRIRQRDEIDINSDGFSDIGRFQNEGVGGSVFAGDEEGLLTLSAHYLHEKRRGGDQIDVPAHLVDVAEGAETWRYGGTLRWEQRLSPSFDYALNLSGAHTERDSFYGGLGGGEPSSPDYDPAAGYGQSTNPVYGVQAKLNYRAGGAHLITFGIQGTREELEDISFTEGSRTIDETYDDIGVFLQDDIVFGPGGMYEILAGARVDSHSAIKDPIYSPRASLRWNPSPAVTVRGGVTSGFNPPQVFDEDLHIEIVGGSPRIIVNAPGLKEERSASFHLNLEYRTISSGVPLSLSLGGFRTSLADAFALVEVGENQYGELVFNRVNEGGAHVQGIEAEAGAVLGAVTVTGGITLQEALYDEEVEFFEGVFSDRIMRTPDIYGNLKLDWEVSPSLDILLAASYTGEMEVPHDTEQPVINTVDPMLTMDADVNWNIQGGFLDNALTVKAGVKNITDEFQEDLDQGAERDAGYVYGPSTPRMFTLGLEVGI